ncbi:ATP/GTP-binding protein [Streptomyces xinghaiensis]|uniref:ATP/GTP-binding protein n=1 Tax=Streptomyces TaxID=1883 RepID=UPI001F521B02|nr:MULTISPECIES: ATP/GTP-binding protein [Streptomyces]
MGTAVTQEAQRRWNKRRSGTDGAAKADTGPGPGASDSSRKAKPSEPGGTAGGSEKVNPSKDRGSKAKDAPTSGPGDRNSGAGKRGGARKGGRTRGHWRAGRTGRRGRSTGSRFRPEDQTPTVEWPDRPTRPKHPDADGQEEDYPDAVIVDDPDDPDDPEERPGRRATASPPPVTAGGLPPAPEPHTQRPGTTRPIGKENSVSDAQVAAASRQGRLPTQHRADITFDEYLMAMANSALLAAAHQEQAEALAHALGKVADVLRDMAADLVGDHNIDTQVTELITDLADAAGRMKLQATRCAQDCDTAKEAARLAAAQVARVYGQDMAAKEEAGLTHASAAAHHD